MSYAIERANILRTVDIRVTLGVLFFAFKPIDMEKLDLVKKYKTYYTAKAMPALVEIEEAKFLSILGQGDPSSDLFAGKIQALYSVAYALKFAYKAKDKDFVVAKLEALWWFDMTRYGHLSIEEAPVHIPRKEWSWRLLIRVPDYVREEEIAKVKHAVREKKDLAYVGEVELFAQHECKAVQVLHVGPFDKEPETLVKIREFMETHQLKHAGLHHEIYLSDFRKTAPEKLRTILREPVR